MELDILFRSCSRVYAVHGGTRIAGESKADVILRCLNSLVRSVEIALAGIPECTIRLTILDDHSDPHCIADMHRLLVGSPFAVSFVALSETGNGNSLRANYEFAALKCPDLIYFVEDDYLHHPTAVLELVEGHDRFRKKLGTEVVLFPCDYPDRYDALYPSLVLLGLNRYWRTVLHTTGTFCISRKTLDRHWESYLRFSEYGITPGVTEDTTINQIYRETPCLSPLPSLTVHIAYPESVSPFTNWQELWEKNQVHPVTDREVRNEHH